MYLQRKDRRKAKKEMLLQGILFGITMVSVTIFGGIVFWLLKSGLSTLNLNFIITETNVMTGNTGIWEYLVNTVFLLFFSLLFSGSMGIMTAVYLCEYAENERIAGYISFAIEILTGIPSIVFGLFGMVFFGEVLKLGYSLLSGTLTLTIMVLPILIENAKEALQAVPKEYKASALALGAGKWSVIQTILLPEACSGILAGFTLAAGKILGESAALIFTAGSRGSLAIAIYRFLGKGQLEAAYGTSLVLLAILVLMNLLLQWIREGYKVKRGKE